MGLTADIVKQLAYECGFELAGITPAVPLDDYKRFDDWRATGMAGEMTYLTDRRGDVRRDPRNLLPTAKSMVCVGKIYHTDHPRSVESVDPTLGWISRYAWGAIDYHDVLREKLQQLVGRIRDCVEEPFESRICVDTVPLLERSYARAAGLGWVGKNTCLINQQSGSWFFLGEVLLSIPLESDKIAPNRCGSCTRCIDACPTEAIVPAPEGGWSIDARLCISYLTIEKRGSVAPELAGKTGLHLFGCDICQDVCPWNGRAPVSLEEVFAPAAITRSLERLADLTEEEFRVMFRSSPVLRAKYEGFLRNVAWAMGNSGRPEMQSPLERLSRHCLPVVSQAARDGLQKLAGDCVSEELE